MEGGLHLSVFSQGVIQMRDRVVDKMRSKERRDGKAVRDEGLGEESCCLEMKLSPQVCQSKTISGRVFLPSPISDSIQYN